MRSRISTHVVGCGKAPGVSNRSIAKGVSIGLGLLFPGIDDLATYHRQLDFGKLHSIDGDGKEVLIPNDDVSQFTWF